jgi:hypothetical protein
MHRPSRHIFLGETNTETLEWLLGEGVCNQSCELEVKLVPIHARGMGGIPGIGTACPSGGGA